MENFDTFIENSFANNKIETINTTEELKKLIENVLFSEDDFFYRGIDSQRNILPTLFREIELKKNSNGDQLFKFLNGNNSSKNIAKKIEYNLIKDLINNGSLYLKDFSLLGVLSTAQHFGLPTRTLDWTNFFTALYFAIGRKGNKNDNNFYYVLCCSKQENIFLNDIPFIRKKLSTNNKKKEYVYMNKVPVYTEIYYRLNQIEDFFKFLPNEKRNIINHNSKMKQKENVIKAYFKEIVKILYLDLDAKQKSQKVEEIYNKVKNGKILFVQPNFNNPRISSQNGLLSIPTSLNSDTLFKQITKNCFVIRINKNLKNDIESILNSAGINGYKIMPDLQYTCENIKGKQINEVLDKYLNEN